MFALRILRPRTPAQTIQPIQEILAVSILEILLPEDGEETGLQSVYVVMRNKW